MVMMNVQLHQLRHKRGMNYMRGAYAAGNKALTIPILELHARAKDFIVVSLLTAVHRSKDSFFGCLIYNPQSDVYYNNIIIEALYKVCMYI